MEDVYRLLENANLVFWDFDGVIKDSVVVKADAFEKLFLPYGQNIATRVRKHHEANGGMSRFEKLPIYLHWAGEKDSEENVNRFCNDFSSLVMREVVDSPWVPGVREFLQSHYQEKKFFLITATPHNEIVQILSELKVDHFFQQIFGAPTEKSVAITEVLKDYDHISRQRALMIGDSTGDYRAAKENDISFLLRRTEFNKSLQESIFSPMFDTLTT